MGEVTLRQYEEAERQMSVTNARRGLWPHGIVTVTVSVALAIVNVFVAPEFPWSVFPFVGMSIGMWFHWYFGVHHGAEFVRNHQEEVEREAERLQAA